MPSSTILYLNDGTTVELTGSTITYEMTQPYQSTVADWGHITLGSQWKQNISATIVHCTDGNVNI